MNLHRPILFSLVMLLMTSCAENPPVEAPPPPPQKVEKPPVRSQPLRYMNGRRFKPQATRELNVRSRCAHRDAVGTRTRLELLVRKAEVSKFDAEITIPRRGTCRFSLKRFTQKEKLPQVVLADRGNPGCTVRMWEQESGKRRQVTVAFNGCRAACNGDTFDYLWPILVDARTGRCF